MFKFIMLTAVLLIVSWGLILKVNDSNVIITINTKVNKLNRGEKFEVKSRDKVCVTEGKGYIDTKENNTFNFKIKKNQCKIVPNEKQTKKSLINRLKNTLALFIGINNDKQVHGVSRKGRKYKKYTHNIIINKNIKHLKISSKLWVETVTLRLIDKNKKVIFSKEKNYDSSNVIKFNIPIYKYKNAKRLIVFDEFNDEVVNSLIIFK